MILTYFVRINDPTLQIEEHTMLSFFPYFIKIYFISQRYRLYNLRKPEGNRHYENRNNR